MSSVAPSGASFLLFSAIFVKESIFSQKYYIFQKHFWVLVLVSTRKKTSKYEIKVFADFSAQIKAPEGSNLGEKAKIKYAVTFCYNKVVLKYFWQHLISFILLNYISDTIRYIDIAQDWADDITPYWVAVCQINTGLMLRINFILLEPTSFSSRRELRKIKQCKYYL